MVSFLDVLRGAVAIVIGKDVINVNLSELDQRLTNLSLNLTSGVPRLYSQVARFEEWRAERNEVFFPIINNADDYFHVLSNWVDNDNYIRDMNAKQLPYELGHGPFSGMNGRECSNFLIDRSQNKLTRAYTQTRIISNSSNVLDNMASMLELPASVDWVSRGAVTTPKDQGQCGSCWAFSTTGAMEGAYFLKTGKLLSFSEQQLVDCDIITNGGSEMGCKGGDMNNCFKWIGVNNGICTEESYYYVSGTTMKSGKCQTSCKTIEGTDVSNFIDVETNSDVAMMTVLSERPVSIAIEADQKDFQLYKSGVFTGDCGTTLDHGVLLVGYGTEGATDYYKVKNSWSTSWGEGGYIKLGKGTDPATGKAYNKGSGQCGVLLEASYPVL